jgi:hypothetical protein
MKNLEKFIELYITARVTREKSWNDYPGPERLEKNSDK